VVGAERLRQGAGGLQPDARGAGRGRRLPLRAQPGRRPDEPRPEEDDAALASWFDTSTDPEVAAAVRAAEEVARKEVPSAMSVPPKPQLPVPPEQPYT
jgi:hypothetical protein